MPCMLQTRLYAENARNLLAALVQQMSRVMVRLSVDTCIRWMSTSARASRVGWQQLGSMLRMAVSFDDAQHSMTPNL
jgi:hypothetical protein